MGYRVSYEPIHKLRHCAMLRSRFLALWSIFFLLFLSLTRICWPAGWAVVCRGMDLAQSWTGQLLECGLASCMSIYEDLRVFAAIR